MDEIEDLYIDEYVMKADSKGEALQMVASRIGKLIPPCLTLSSPGKDMKEALYCAVRQKKWALHVAGSSPKSPVMYKQFLEELSTWRITTVLCMEARVKHKRTRQVR